MGEVPQDPDLEAQGEVTDAQAQKDARKARDINKLYNYSIFMEDNDAQPTNVLDMIATDSSPAEITDTLKVYDLC